VTWNGRRGARAIAALNVIGIDSFSQRGLPPRGRDHVSRGHARPLALRSGEWRFVASAIRQNGGSLERGEVFDDCRGVHRSG
jgi:hypothetical protein